jgi:uncharacterized OB-fold protein
MSKSTKSAPAKQAAPAVQADTVEAVEQQDQGTVETVTAIDQADAAEEDEPAAAATGYVVQWAIKLDGKRYAIGDHIDISDSQAAPFVASGAIKAKE